VKMSLLRLATVAAVLGAAMWLGVGSASAAAPAPVPIGPNQTFVGTINGIEPTVPGFHPAPVRVVCPGPVVLGRKGHPAGGQPVEVLRATAASFRHGSTGRAGTSVVATFRNDPSMSLTFTDYGVAQPIPTRLLLPCSGFGLVGFVPRPASPGGIGEWLVVRFVNIAV
jgi:hypothetical protein